MIAVRRRGLGGRMYIFKPSDVTSVQQMGNLYLRFTLKCGTMVEADAVGYNSQVMAFTDSDTPLKNCDESNCPYDQCIIEERDDPN